MPPECFDFFEVHGLSGSDLSAKDSSNSNCLLMQHPESKDTRTDSHLTLDDAKALTSPRLKLKTMEERKMLKSCFNSKSSVPQAFETPNKTQDQVPQIIQD